MKTIKMLAVSGIAVCLLALTGCSSTESQHAETKVVKKKAGLTEAPIAGCNTAQARKKKRCQR